MFKCFEKVPNVFSQMVVKKIVMNPKVGSNKKSPTKLNKSKSSVNFPPSLKIARTWHGITRIARIKGCLELVEGS